MPVPSGPRGQRGPAGPAGTPGPAGPAGEAGIAGGVGESGLAGLPGTQGTQDTQGPAGPAGEAGDTGESGTAGLTGLQGRPGINSAVLSFTRHQVLAMFAFVVVAFVALAFLTQIQGSNLHRSIVSARALTAQVCHQRQDAEARTNATWDQLAEIERNNPSIDDTVRLARLKVYESSNFIPPACVG